MPTNAFQRVQPRRTSRLPLYLGVLVIIGIAYYFLSNSSSTPIVTTSQTFTIPLNSSIYFTLPNSTNVYSIFLKSSSNSSAILYISALPILAKPIIIASLLSGSALNISTTTLGNANLNIALQSSTKAQAKIMLTPLLSTLGIRQSALAILNPSVVLQGGTSTSINTVATTTIVTTTIPTTTVVGSQTTVTTASTTLATTQTTTVGSTTPTAQVMSAANATSLGTLLKNFKTLYINGQSCTSSIYNTTYQVKFGSFPKSYNTYQNMTQVTPTNLNFAITQVGTSLYNVTYSTVAPSSQASGAAVVLEINIANGAQIASSFIGPFRGLNYTVLNNQYNYALGISNNCAIVIPYVPGH